MFDYFSRFILTDNEQYKGLDPYYEEDAKVIAKQAQKKREKLLSEVNFKRYLTTELTWWKY